MVLEIPDFGRNQLAAMLSLLGYKLGVEVGVAGGDYSKILCDYNPDMLFWGVDPYEIYSGYRDYARETTIKGLRTKAHRRLDSYRNYTFIEEYSNEAAENFTDGMLDFVYLDANHSEPYISEDIKLWWPKLKEGGILAGHDYANTKHRDGTALHHHVKPAIQKFCKENNKQLIVLGREANDEGIIRDRPRSWVVFK